jgi:hypothetical protein
MTAGLAAGVELRGFEPLTFSNELAVESLELHRPISPKLANSSTLQRIASSDTSHRTCAPRASSTLLGLTFC